VVVAMAAGYETWRSRFGRAPVRVAEEGVEPDVAREA
jgi:hypothetical protein